MCRQFTAHASPHARPRLTARSHFPSPQAQRVAALLSTAALAAPAHLEALAERVLALHAHQLIVLAAQAAALCSPGRREPRQGGVRRTCQHKATLCRASQGVARAGVQNNLPSQQRGRVAQAQASRRPQQQARRAPTRVAQDDPGDAKVVQHLRRHLAGEGAALAHPAVLIVGREGGSAGAAELSCRGAECCEAKLCSALLSPLDTHTHILLAAQLQRPCNTGGMRHAQPGADAAPWQPRRQAPWGADWERTRADWERNRTWAATWKGARSVRFTMSRCTKVGATTISTVLGTLPAGGGRRRAGQRHFQKGLATWRATSSA